MKICLCSNTRPHAGGVTVYLNTLSHGLRRFGNEVDIITTFGPAKSINPKNKFTAAINGLIKKFPFSTIFFYQINKLFFIFNLYLAFIKKKYDIVHAMDFSAANSSYFLTRFFKIPLIVSAHGFLESSEYLSRNKILKKYFLKKIIRAYQRTALVISAAAYVDDDLMAKNIDPSKIVRVKNFVDLSLFQPDLNLRKIGREKLSLDPSEIILLCIARMEERKGVIYPLLALLETIKREPDIPLKLIYVGEGPQKEILENKVKENNLEKTVIFLGSVPHKNLPGIYNLADILIIPSITFGGKGEPQGITPLEAMASGLPVIAFASGGLPEIIKNEDNGLLIKEKDVSNLSQAIIRLVQNQALKTTVCKNALDYVRRNHSQDKIIPEMIKCYKFSMAKENENQ